MIQSTLLTKRTLKDTQNCLPIGKGAQGQSRRYNCSPKGWGHLSSRSFLGQCPDFKGRDSNCRPIARRKTNSKWGLWQPPFITLGWNLTCDQILSVVHKLLSTKVFHWPRDLSANHRALPFLFPHEGCHCARFAQKGWGGVLYLSQKSTPPGGPQIFIQDKERWWDGESKAFSKAV